MSFLLARCKELSYKDLLVVNGGCSSAPSISGACSGSSTSSGSGTGGSSGGIIIRGTSVTGSSSGSGSSYSCSGSINMPSGKPSVAASNNCSGSAVETKKTTTESSSSTVSVQTQKGENIVGYTISKLYSSIMNNLNHKYLVTGNANTEYRCDQWVEEVLNEAGYDANKYLNGSSTETVAQHISKLEAGSYTNNVPKEAGAYVVFMTNGSINGQAVTDHCALLIVGENQKMEIWDNSSSNKCTEYQNGVSSSYMGGVGKTDVFAVNTTKISDYCYNKYYFQKIG